MHWLIWVLISLVFYGMMPPLVKSAMKEIPSYVAATVTNAILCSLAFIVAKIQGYSFTEHLSFDQPSLILYAAGGVLAVAIISYYKALELGPISSVVPIFGMHIALASVIGFIVLKESITPTKGLGLLFAILAVILISR